MKQAIFLSIIALVTVTGVFAQSVTVPGDFATVSAAITSVLGNPTTPDVITVSSGTYTEAAGLAIIANSAEDTDFTLQGADPTNRPIIVVGPTAGQPSTTLNGHGVVASVAAYNGGGEANWTVNLRNLIIIPEVGSAPARGFYANTNATGLSTDALQSINIDNVCVTANNGSNVPLTTTGLSLMDTTGATLFTDDGIYLTGREGDSSVTRSVATHLAGGSPDGLVYYPDIGSESSLTIGPGCVFSFTDRIGVQIASDAADVTINGTKSEPVIIMGSGSAFGGGNQFNGGLAIFHDNNSDAGRDYDINYLYILNNNQAGIDVFYVDDADSAPTATFNNCIIAGNGVDANPNGIQLGDDLVGTWTLNNCTILDNRGAIAVLDEGGGGSTGTVNFNDCILGGSSGTTAGNANDEQIEVVVAGYTVNLTNSALVANGNNAVAGTGIINDNGATVNQTAVIGDDPAFVSAARNLAADMLDVTAAAYAAAGTAGAPLSGAEDYVNTLGQTSLSITVDGDPSDWTGAAGAAGSLVFDSGTNQVIYNDPTGDNNGDGDYTNPTNAAFNDTQTDIEEVRIAHDGTNLYVLVISGDQTGTGFGADFETTMTQVLVNNTSSNGPSAGDLGGFSNQSVASRLGWEVLAGLGQTDGGVFAAAGGDFGNNVSASVTAVQDEANNAIEFAIPFSLLSNFNGREYNIVVAQGYSDGGSFRDVNGGAEAEYQGGNGDPASAINGQTSKVYDLAAPALSQTDQETEIQNAVLSASEIPVLITDLLVTSVNAYELYR